MPAINTVNVLDVLPSVLELGPTQSENQVVLLSTSDGLTAHAGGGQTNALPIVSNISRFTTVATAGDSAVLPLSLVGMQIVIYNAATTNSMNVYPSSSDNTGAGGKINALSANAAYAVAAGHIATFYCTTAGQWYTSNVAQA
jgi:hypothetical protein